MRIKLAILAVLLLASLAQAQGDVEVVVPENVATGTLVVAQITDLGTRSAAWLPVAPIDLVYHTDADGSAVTFSSGCEPSQIVLIVTVIDWDAHHFDQRRVLVTVGEGPGPDPGPDPDPTPPPPPPPGERRVVILAEEDNNTAPREIEIELLRRYCDQAGHQWDMYDPDQKDASGQTPSELADYLKVSKEAGVALPAMIVIAQQTDKDLATAVPLPPAGTTPDSGKVAGQKAIVKLKELGG